LYNRNRTNYLRKEKMINLDQILSSKVAEVIGREDLEKKIQEEKKLKVKWGADPTAPDLHLGHAVILRKLKEFQDAGHEVILLIGDYTAKIGDPSGKIKTRPMLSDEEINEGAESYLGQASKILDKEKITIKKNSEWFSKISFADVLKLLSKMTVASILERDDFEKRLKEGIDIGLHEILYPVMQAYDSVVLKCDIEIGGTDQKFNMLAGRSLMKKMNLSPQAVITMPILMGTCGKQKMSKSLGNYIGLTDQPSQMYGKVMSIPDDLIVPYFELCTDMKAEAIEVVKKELDEDKNPRNIKARLAKLITETYHDAQAAEEAENEFNRVFRDKEKPTEMQELNIKKSRYAVMDLIQRAGTSSLSEAKRLIIQGGVRIDDKVVSDPNVRIEPKEGTIIQIGKRRFYRVRLI